MAVLQRGLLYQAAAQAPLVNLLRLVQAVWSQAVAACLRLKGANLVLNRNHHLSLVLLQQEVGVKILYGALSS